jgi:hypothetical protein
MLFKTCLNGAYNKAIVFQLCFRICHSEGPRKSGGIETEWNIEALLDAYKVGLEINGKKTRYMFMSHHQT